MTMTREEFEAFAVERSTGSPRTGLHLRRGLILIIPPYDVVPCECGDRNCHGWRLVEVRPATLQHLPDREDLRA